MILYLIGYMYSGKSSVARALARRLRGMNLKAEAIDTDALFEQRYRLSVADCFARYDEPMFRTLEAAVLRSIEDSPDTFSIVSTGGGTPCHKDNLAFMLDHGKVAFLNPPEETLLSRLENTHKPRPLFTSLPPADRPAFLRSQLSERLSFYSQAHITLTSSDEHQVVSILLDFIL